MKNLNPFLILLALTITAPPHSLHAHAPQTQHITHNIKLTATPQYLDVTIDIAFTATQSTELYNKADTNHDGKISSQENDHFLTQLNFPKDHLPLLTVDSKPIPLMQLYAPKLELQRNPTNNSASAVLHLSYFTPTPPQFNAGQSLIIQDRFNADQTVTVAFIAHGTHGVTLGANSPITTSFPAQTQKKLIATCLTTPDATTPDSTTPDTTTNKER